MSDNGKTNTNDGKRLYGLNNDGSYSPCDVGKVNTPGTVCGHLIHLMLDDDSASSFNDKSKTRHTNNAKTCEHIKDLPEFNSDKSLEIIDKRLGENPVTGADHKASDENAGTLDSGANDDVEDANGDAAQRTMTVKNDDSAGREIVYVKNDDGSLTKTDTIQILKTDGKNADSQESLFDLALDGDDVSENKGVANKTTKSKDLKTASENIAKRSSKSYDDNKRRKAQVSLNKAIDKINGDVFGDDAMKSSQEKTAEDSVQSQQTPLPAIDWDNDTPEEIKAKKVQYWKERIKNELGIDFQERVRIGTIKKKPVYADLGYKNILLNINTSAASSYDLATCYCGDTTPEKNHTKCASLKNRSWFLNMAKEARANGKDLVQLYDWMDDDIAMDIIRSKCKMQHRKFFARKTYVKEITQGEANAFLDLYHTQGGTRKQSYCVGLFDKKTDELFQVQTFGKSRYNKNYQWEAIRLATKFDCVIVGGVTKGYKKFVKDKDPDSCLSYVDFDRSNGGTDEATGFTFTGYSGVKCYWVDPKDPNKRYTDMFLRNKGIDKVLDMPYWAFPDYDGTFEHSNAGLMLAQGFVRVYTSGNMVYGWHRGEKIA